MRPEDWPLLNAVLNGSSGVFLVAGYVAIRCRRVTLHKGCMLTALCVSAAFLASYLYSFLVVRGGQSTSFGGSPEVRVIYLAILISHMILAAATAPLALYTAYLGLTDRLARHVRIARWTLPIWLYVSVTGVIVYLMLRPYYHAGSEG